MRDLAEAAVAIRREQCRERRILGVVGGEQQLAVRRQRHFIDSRGAAGADCLFDGGRVRRVEIDHLERAVAVAGIEPPAVRHDAVGPGDDCCPRRCRRR